MTQSTQPDPAALDGEQTPNAPVTPVVPERLDLAAETVSHRRSIRTETGTIDYSVTAGYLDVLEERKDDEQRRSTRIGARIFHTSYVQEGGDPTQRPVIFIFNGGPGSASLWLHLGLFGPRIVPAADPTTPLSAPYTLRDNPQTLLAQADLVFIDPADTGFSRTTRAVPADEYHGAVRDFDSVAEVIHAWTSRNGRWLAPKFIAGESYGTFRAVGVAHTLLERYGLAVNGLVLISATLGVNGRGPNATIGTYAGFLPTYAAIAHYHGLHEGRSLEDVVAEAQEFATGDYLRVLYAGSRLGEEETAAAAGTIAALTGLDPDYVRRARLRIEHVRFFTEVLRRRGLVTGRLDARYVGTDPDGVRERYDEDPSSQAYTGYYAAAINHYLRSELGFTSALPHHIINPEVRPWKQRSLEEGGHSVVPELSRLLRANPRLRVQIAFGYYDGATPFEAAEFALSQLEVPRDREANLDRRYYRSGHLTYLHEETRVQQSADIAGFIRDSIG